MDSSSSSIRQKHLFKLNLLIGVSIMEKDNKFSNKLLKAKKIIVSGIVASSLLLSPSYLSSQTNQKNVFFPKIEAPYKVGKDKKLKKYIDKIIKEIKIEIKKFFEYVPALPDILASKRFEVSFKIGFVTNKEFHENSETEGEKSVSDTGIPSNMLINISRPLLYNELREKLFFSFLHFAWEEKRGLHFLNFDNDPFYDSYLIFCDYIKDKPRQYVLEQYMYDILHDKEEKLVFDIMLFFYYTMGPKEFFNAFFSDDNAKFKEVFDNVLGKGSFDQIFPKERRELKGFKYPDNRVELYYERNLTGNEWDEIEKKLKEKNLDYILENINNFYKKFKFNFQESN